MDHEGPFVGATVEKAVGYWEISSMVVEEGGEAHTINLCRQCYNEQLVQQGKSRLKVWQWKGDGVEESASWIRGVWEYFALERAEVKKIPADASREYQEGIQGQWQQESPFGEVLEQVQGNAEIDCGSQMMRRGSTLQ